MFGSESLEIRRLGLELLQKGVSLPHPLNDVGFACDNLSTTRRERGHKARRQTFGVAHFL